MDNITLTINGEEVIIPDRSEEKWKAMAINLWWYLHPNGADYIKFYVHADRDVGTWKEEAIKLYIKSREVGA